MIKCCPRFTEQYSPLILNIPFVSSSFKLYFLQTHSEGSNSVRVGRDVVQVAVGVDDGAAVEAVFPDDHLQQEKDRRQGCFQPGKDDAAYSSIPNRFPYKLSSVSGPEKKLFQWILIFRKTSLPS